MNAHAPGRGEDLVTGGQAIGIGPQWLARLWSGGIDRILDRIDRGLVRGSIQATFPDGTTRLLGGRAEGFGAVVEIRSWRALLRLATAGSVGWYQAWEAGEWSSPDPVPLFALFMDNAVPLGDTGRAHGPWRLLTRFVHWLHRNTRSGSLRNIHAHYDLGNDFYEQWLGEAMIYSSALYSAAGQDGPNALSQFVTELDAAQSAKVGAIVERLDLEPGDRVLEIGCGWGTLAAFMAEHAQVHVDAISLSDEQLDFARGRWQIAQGSVDFRKQDYRDVSGTYDAVASVEMVEAVGRQFWPDFLDCVARNLKPWGRAAIQFIAMRDEIFDGYARSADFIQTFVFPGGMLIKESEFRRLAEERGLIWEDRHGFGGDYARTLRQWRQNFDMAVEEGRLPPGFDERFVQLWRFYLMYCEGGFLGGGIDVAQVTLVKEG
ncbi:SAM-dependent methyltransferase [Novosphingobium album (ex Hu et al. 2023)]|uniref:Cyclopropane-fatty-acyl-phospholipid synthase family protein n=1 Tax=Novosphingobium album (ex Hu et al. 2023) TaxID=2930093 RepID=A0ABT0AW87_9SPHN|nr:cyclopropane-fatty-acyl-phospholipid synthase family protein [Novosphingobium album (ex Hu et al. 2023)]MCJ2177098.1 cyclopropane-fatty-acyl-phospholipid synthase family protein [Novosphingobium album (ex Hu et al. 2023)]